MESQATPLTAEPVSKSSSSSVSRSSLTSGYLLSLDDALHLEKKGVGAKKVTLLNNVETVVVKDMAYEVSENAHRNNPANNSMGNVKSSILVSSSSIPSNYCHSRTQPQHELVLDLIMGRKPPYSRSVPHLITVVYPTRNF